MTRFSIDGKQPVVTEGVFIAPNAVLAGDVHIAAGVSVWFGVVIRSESEQISVGVDSNVQDQAVIHTDTGFAVRVGARVTIGHGAEVHGCEIRDDAIVGIRATVLNGARVGEGAIVGAGAVVPEGATIPNFAIAVGVPAKVITAASGEVPRPNVGEYLRIAAQYQRQIRGDKSPRVEPHDPPW